MNKHLVYCVLCLLAFGVLVGFAALPVKSSVSTVDCDAVDGSWSSFNWRWGQSESVAVTVRVTSAGTPLDVSGGQAGYVMIRQDATGIVTYLNATNVTIATSNLSISVASTSMPPAGVYLMEFYGFDATTNKRTYAQGRVTVFRSLY
jgi:hypothetical protein